MTADEWLAGFAAAAGVEAPTADEVDTLLDLAGLAAHASERTAAPITCWIAATAGLSPTDALALAESLTQTGA
jgi:Domain of unknown function (DUF6457)